MAEAVKLWQAGKHGPSPRRSSRRGEVPLGGVSP